jgi:haloalkane dehalogenase
VGGLRIAYLDEGEGRPLLMLHGEPTWSYLFRKMIPPLRDAGYRCVAIDYPGFGRSDKPVDERWYSYDRHTEVVGAMIEGLDLRDVVLVGHDWGGPVGVRLAVESQAERFDRFVLIDTPFFTGRQVMPPPWWEMHDMILETPDMPIGDLIRRHCAVDPGDEVIAAYEAPFPDAAAKAGARAFPLHVLPKSADRPAAKACWRVMKAMRKDDRPTLTLWGGGRRHAARYARRDPGRALPTRGPRRGAGGPDRRLAGGLDGFRRFSRRREDLPPDGQRGDGLAVGIRGGDEAVQLQLFTGAQLVPALPLRLRRAGERAEPHRHVPDLAVREADLHRVRAVAQGGDHELPRRLVRGRVESARVAHLHVVVDLRLHRLLDHRPRGRGLQHAGERVVGIRVFCCEIG